MEAIYNFHWPGNIRELQNTLQRYLAIGNLDFLKNHRTLNEPIDNHHKTSIEMNPSGLNLKQKVEFYEKDLLLAALNQSNWNRNKALKLLNIPRRTLYHKMKKFGLI